MKIQQCMIFQGWFSDMEPT